MTVVLPYLRAHARTLYIYARVVARTIDFRCIAFFAIIENQLLMKKVMFFSIFSALKFGQSKKKQYLCTRFAPEVSELLKRQKSH